MHYLNDEARIIQQTAQKIARTELRPLSATWSEAERFPQEGMDALAKAGLMGMLIPDKWGGGACSYLSYALAIEEIAYGDASVSTIMSVHNSVAVLPIVQYGTVWQQDYFLPQLATGNWLGAFCLTEPAAGSDAANIATKAIKTKDGYVLSGTKQFITSGKEAKIAIVFATTSPTLGKQGITAFIVPTDTPGFNVARIEKKMGQHAATTAQIVFNDMFIEEKLRLGEEGVGYKIALSNLEGGRIGIAAQALGIARAALEESIAYAKTRSSFHKNLIEHQAIAFKLADMATHLEAARLLVHNAAIKKDCGEPCLQAASMAKLFATEAAENICREAIQIHGGYGYLRDFPLQQWYNDVRVTTIYEGTSEVQRMVIARGL